MAGDAGLTLTGEFLGTLRYASPEQALARRGVVDHRSDVYSLGATLYELLTLRPIFEGRDRNELLRQIADEEPRPPRSLHPSIPRELETVVLKALRKEPAERYPTARELADDLRRFLDNSPCSGAAADVGGTPPQTGAATPVADRRQPGAAGSPVRRIAAEYAARPRRTAAHQGRTAQRGRGYRRERQRRRGGRGPVPARGPLRGRDVPHQPGGTGRPAGPGGAAQAAALVGPGLLPGVPRTAPRRRRGAGGLARRETARGEDPRRSGRAARRQPTLLAVSAGGARRPAAWATHSGPRVKEFCARVGKEWVASLADVGRLSAGRAGTAGRRACPDLRGRVNRLLTPAQRLASARSDSRRRGRAPSGTGSGCGIEAHAEQREQIRTIEDEALFGWIRHPRSANSGKAVGARKKSANDRIVACSCWSKCGGGES